MTNHVLYLRASNTWCFLTKCHLLLIDQMISSFPSRYLFLNPISDDSIIIWEFSLWFFFFLKYSILYWIRIWFSADFQQAIIFKRNEKVRVSLHWKYQIINICQKYSPNRNIKILLSHSLQKRILQKGNFFCFLWNISLMLTSRKFFKRSKKVRKIRKSDF